jgi:ubiquinone/menaquinone biosynthesis C-methylase UbiE
MRSLVLRTVDALNVEYFRKFERVLDLGQMLRVRAATPLLGSDSFDRVLDVGAGGGYLTALLCQRSRRLTSLDLELGPLRNGARFLNRVNRSNVDLIAGDAVKLPCRDAVADLVTCTDVIEHIEEDRKAVGELARVLKPGAILLLTTTSDEFVIDTSEYRSFGHVRTGYRTSDLVAMLRANGLVVEDVIYFKKCGLSRWLLWVSRRCPVLGPLLRTVLVPISYPILLIGERLSKKGYNVCVRARRTAS